MAFPDLENLEPEEPNTNRCYADNGAKEKEEHQEEEDDVVDWEDFGRLDEYPVHWVEDLVVAQYIAAVAFAN